MAAHTPSGGFNPNLDGPIGNTPAQAPPTYFHAPELRTKVVQILAQTTNACLQELNLHPRMAQEITELNSRIDDYHTKNRKLYEDNKSLLSMVREAHSKLSAYSATIHQLEQQVTALHKANHEVLMRERSLAAGNPAYKQLQSEYMHLSSFCEQLKKQVTALQRMVYEKPTLQHLPGPNRHPAVIAEGGQPLPIKQSAAHNTREAVREPQEHPNRIQPQYFHTSALGKDRPSQEVSMHPSVSRQSIVGRPGLLNQPNQGNNPISVAPMYPSIQSKLSMINNNASQISESSSSPSATHNSGAMRIGAPEAVGPVPKITGWMDGSSPQGVVTRPRAQNHSIHAASAQHSRSGSAQLHSSASFSTTSPKVDQNNRNMKPHSVIIRPPDVNMPPGTNFVPIGPPGKLLPPLTASVMKHSSPPSRPPSARASLPSGTLLMPESAHATEINRPPLDTRMPAIERSRTPNLTPTSSRNSVAPSEGELEATTPLDDHVNHTVKVVKSPVSEVGVESGVVVLDDAISTSSLKRNSVDMHGDEDGNSSDVGERARKRLKMSEDVPFEREEAGKTISTNSSLQVMDEDTGDGEEEIEFGPDGKPSLEYCLDVFTEEDGDADVCALCRLRQKSGLISTPTVFPPNVTQEAKVQHFLDEHPTAWENMRNGRGCS